MYCLFVHLVENSSLLDMTEMTTIAVSFHCDMHDAFLTHSHQAAVVTNVKVVVQKVGNILNNVWWGVLLNSKLVVEFYTVFKAENGLLVS